jgi:hypothetical protein
MFIYFILLIVIGSWGLMNIITGLLFSSIIEQRERASRLEAEDLERNLSNAFSALDPRDSGLVSLSDAKLVVRDALKRFKSTIRVPFWDILAAPFFWCYCRCTDQTKLETDKVNDLMPKDRSNELASSIYIQRAVDESHLDALMDNLIQKVPPHSIEDGSCVMLRREAFDLIPLHCLSDEAANCKADTSSIGSSMHSRKQFPMAAYSRLQAILGWADGKLFDVCSDSLIALFSIQYLFGVSREAVFLIICALHAAEAMLRFISKGIERFFESLRNTIDLAITLCLVSKTFRNQS